MAYGHSKAEGKATVSNKSLHVLNARQQNTYPSVSPMGAESNIETKNHQICLVTGLLSQVDFSTSQELSEEKQGILIKVSCKRHCRRIFPIIPPERNSPSSVLRRNC